MCTFGDHSHGQLGRTRPTRADACSIWAHGHLPRLQPLPVRPEDGNDDEAQQLSGRVAQLAAGEMHTIALSSAGEVWSWGDNMLHQCARALDEPLLPTPGRVLLPLRPKEHVVQISASGYHGLALTNEGRVLAIGGVVGDIDQNANTDDQTDLLVV